jgi:hypothetical protein
MTSFFSLLPLGVFLVLVQVVAALPWLAALNWNLLQSWARQEGPGKLAARLGIGLAAGGGVGVLAGLFLGIVQDSETLFRLGRIYASLLHLQLIADLLVAIFALMLLVWPKGGAVALAAFREAVRQPMYWLIFGVFALFMFGLTFLPLFTFGEDLIMMKELDYDVIMMATLLFGVLAAGITIHEEIEGRTAITLMSKPVSRRQFLLGKFAGILLSALVMTLSLGWFFYWFLLLKRVLPGEMLDPVTRPEVTERLQNWGLTGEGLSFGRGIAFWFVDVWENAPGLVFSFSKVMVLLSVAVALATRLPLIINLVACGVVYLLGNLTPVVVQAASVREQVDSSPSEVTQILLFVAKLFDTLLPRLDYFSLDQALLNEASPPSLPFNLYVGSVFLYAVLYTTIVLLFGLILFEDRDLA